MLLDRPSRSDGSAGSVVVANADTRSPAAAIAAAVRRMAARSNGLIGSAFHRSQPRKHSFGRALGEDDDLAARPRRADGSSSCARAPARRSARRSAARRVSATAPCESGVGGEAAQRDLGRIARHLAIGRDVCVVADRHRLEQRRVSDVGAVIGGRSRRMLVGDDRLDAHAVLGECPGLVDADDVTEPSVSTAGSRWMSALRRTNRRAPIASAIVTTAGSASGIAATAMLNAVMSMRPNGSPRQTPATRMTRRRARPPATTTAGRVDRADAAAASAAGPSSRSSVAMSPEPRVRSRGDNDSERRARASRTSHETRRCAAVAADDGADRARSCRRLVHRLRFAGQRGLGCLKLRRSTRPRSAGTSCPLRAERCPRHELGGRHVSPCRRGARGPWARRARAATRARARRVAPAPRQAPR